MINLKLTFNKNFIDNSYNIKQMFQLRKLIRVFTFVNPAKNGELRKTPPKLFKTYSRCSFFFFWDCSESNQRTSGSCVLKNLSLWRDEIIYRYFDQKFKIIKEKESLILSVSKSSFLAKISLSWTLEIKNLPLTRSLTFSGSPYAKSLM